MPDLLNVEIKARCKDPEAVRRVLRSLEARFEGVDRQVDTYFRVEDGRLKLRQGSIENSLIHYQRPNEHGPKNSEVCLVRFDRDMAELRRVLTTALGVLVEVSKIREIYYLGNAKIHLDLLEGFGEFVEIEVIDRHGEIGEEQLAVECQLLMNALGVDSGDLVAESYSDLLLSR